jgi:hypothetical protein
LADVRAWLDTMWRDNLGDLKRAAEAEARAAHTGKNAKRRRRT